MPAILFFFIAFCCGLYALITAAEIIYTFAATLIRQWIRAHTLF